MSGDIAIKIENVSKRYNLGVIGYGTLAGDLQAWWARVRGRENPHTKVSESMFADLLRQNGSGQFWALKDVSLDVKRGEVLGIIGRNGAGKTTLLKILSKITAPTRGSVKIKGQIASLLEVGTGFHPELTGRENVYLNGAILGLKKHEVTRKFDEILSFAEIEKFIDTPVKRYSSGMRVRLAFAVAAYLEPEILLIDEVLAVGDAAFQQKCLGKMGEVAHEGRTVLFVSHNMSAMRQLTNSCVLLDRGEIVDHGKTNDVVGKYLSTTLDSGRMGAVDLSTPEVRKDVQKAVAHRIVFQSIRSLNSKGEVTNLIEEREPFSFELTLTSFINAPSLEIIAVFFTLEELRVTSCFYNSPREISTGNHTLVLDFADNRFCRGNYKIKLLMRTGAWQDVINGAITFQVVPTGKSRNAGKRARLIGAVDIDYSWEEIR